LIQLDSDLQPSAFDAIVALDAGVDQLLTYREVDELNVIGLVHGAMFTRGPKQLHRTAIFIGGSDVGLGERLLKKVVDAFFGPFRVSVMLDSNGSNTTAVAAVLSAQKNRSLRGVQVAVLGGTGPVGRRIAQLCARQEAAVQIVSRDRERAAKVIGHLGDGQARIRPTEAQTPEQLAEVLRDAEVVFSAGAAGVEMLSAAVLSQLAQAKLLIDLNAVPPLGIAGVRVDDQGTARDGRVVFGAIGVGGLKMIIHRRAIDVLFASNGAVLDTASIFELAQAMIQSDPAPA
jgi:hypothetical protein